MFQTYSYAFGVDQQSKMKLVAKHLVSPELIKQPASAVLLNEDESLSVMINEEDHIRIQALGTDLSLNDLYQRASKIDDDLDQELDISYDEHLGYLTTCPTNIAQVCVRVSCYICLDFPS